MTNKLQEHTDKVIEKFDKLEQGLFFEGKFSIDMIRAFMILALQERDQITVDLLEKERDMYILNNPPMPNTVMFETTRQSLIKLDPVVNTYDRAIELIKGDR